MPLETSTTIAGLVSTNPIVDDGMGEGDDHLRLIKSVLKATFPGAGGVGFATPITATEAQINSLASILAKLNNQIVNVKDFGALGDGVTDDTIAINNARIYAKSLGGGIVFYPVGTYIVDFYVLSLLQRVAILVETDVHHKGAGIGATKIFLKNGASSHVFLARSATNCSVSDMTIDGNRDNQTIAPSGQDSVGVLFVENTYNSFAHNLHIKNTFDYGIGVQVGTAIDHDISNVLIENAGSDGVDYKNTNFNSKGNRIRALTVRGFGMQDTTETFAGLNIRGEVFASQIRIERVGQFIDVGRDGIRLEGTWDGITDSMRTILTDFVIIGEDDTARDDQTVMGLRVRSRNISVSNGYVTKCGYGVRISQGHNNINNVIVENNRRGLALFSGETDGGNPMFTYPVQCNISNIIARGNWEIGVRLEDLCTDNSLMNISSQNNGVNLSFAAGADNNTVSGGSLQTPITTNVSDSGAGNLFKFIRGYKTESNVLSDEFALDATGVTSIDIPHGLDITPERKNISLLLSVDTATEDFVIGYILIRDITSTNVAIKVRVTTASATVGLKGCIALTVLHS